MIWSVFFKAIPTFLHTWRIYIATGAILTAAIVLFNYVGNHGEMKAQLVAGKEVVEDQALEIAALREEIKARDARLILDRELKLAELEAARVRLDEANAIIDELRAEQERVQAELKATRKATREAIQNDQVLADWADNSVPPAAWRLLQQAAEAGSD